MATWTTEKHDWQKWLWSDEGSLLIPWDGSDRGLLPFTVHWFVPLLVAAGGLIYLSAGLPRTTVFGDLSVAAIQNVGGLFWLIGVLASLSSLDSDGRDEPGDRFSLAVDRLGSDQIETRLAGIHALERLATASEQYNEPMIELLEQYRQGRANSQDRLISEAIGRVLARLER